jgi:hypothetical protein
MPECCTSAHNLEIVRRQLYAAEMEIAALNKRVKELEAFKRLAYRLAGEKVPDA